MNEAESGGEPEAERSEVARPARSEGAAEPDPGERGPEPAGAPEAAEEPTAEPREPAGEGVPAPEVEPDPAEGPAEAPGAGDALGEADAGETTDLAESEETEEAEEAPQVEEAGEAEEPEEPKPLGVELRPTGHAPVDARLRRLAEADHLTVFGHLEVYEDVHRGLRETLAELDRTPGG